MWFFYLWAVIVGLVDACLWVKNRRVVWWEWAASTGAAFALAGLFQLIAVHGMTDDVETWSGRVVAAVHTGAWTEAYEEAIYRTEYYYTNETESYTDSKGRSRSRSVRVQHSKEVFDHWEPRTRFHSDGYDCSTDLCGVSIDAGKYAEIVHDWGDEEHHQGRRTTWEHNSHMIGGDPYDYAAVNKNAYIVPVIATRHFENRIKAAPTVFSFPKVPPSIKVFDYPENHDVFTSDRLLGTANSIGIRAWDQMNSALGFSKKVNVIACGFGTDADSSIAQWQKAKWVGGKKNDVVICFGGGTIQRPSWCEVFGWSDSNVCKHDLETIVLDNPMTSEITDKIRNEIVANYEKKNWHQFDYISIQPPTWSYIAFLCVVIPVQAGMWFFFLTNGINKNENDSETPNARARKLYQTS